MSVDHSTRTSTSHEQSQQRHPVFDHPTVGRYRTELSIPPDEPGAFQIRFVGRDGMLQTHPQETQQAAVVAGVNLLLKRNPDDIDIPYRRGDANDGELIIKRRDDMPKNADYSDRYTALPDFPGLEVLNQLSAGCKKVIVCRLAATCGLKAEFVGGWELDPKQLENR